MKVRFYVNIYLLSIRPIINLIRLPFWLFIEYYYIATYYILAIYIAAIGLNSVASSSLNIIPWSVV